MGSDFSTTYPELSARYRRDVAARLAQVATERRTITYAELSDLFAVPQESLGQVLGGIAVRLQDQGLPLLSVLAVDEATGFPSTGTQLYSALGLVTEEDLQREQDRCFEFVWTRSSLPAGTRVG